MNTLIGIDWSEEYHEVRIDNEAGACVARFRIPHTWQGFQRLAERIAQVNPEPNLCGVAIETADSLLVDFLWSQGYQVYVLAPSRVKGSRSRQRASGARDDDSDAALLADILRTDRQGLIAWEPDGEAVCQMRLLLSFVDDLTASMNQYTNRLRTCLLRTYPQGLKAFSKLTVPLCLHFLMAYPTPEAALALTYPEFKAFCRAHGDTQVRSCPKRFATLQQATPPLAPSLQAAYAVQIPWIAQLLLNLVEQKRSTLRHLQTLFEAHPHHALFASLPGAGELLGPKLLVMFGDHRSRLPTPEVIQALAGTCPVTIKSGKSQSVQFRRACNHTYRNTMQQFAKESVSQSPWALAYFEAARSRGLSKSQAYRRLANRWLNIIWTLWQRSQLYDETYHLRQIQRRRQPVVTVHTP
jgi:transposase